ERAAAASGVVVRARIARVDVDAARVEGEFASIRRIAVQVELAGIARREHQPFERGESAFEIATREIPSRRPECLTTRCGIAHDLLTVNLQLEVILLCVVERE